VERKRRLSERKRDEKFSFYIPPEAAKLLKLLLSAQNPDVHKFSVLKKLSRSLSGFNFSLSRRL
jgi:hypothetical protein